MRLESIVIGMDFSDTAIKAARWVTDYFAPGTATTLAFVIPPPDQPAFAGHLVPSSAAIEAVAREYADTHMRDLADLSRLRSFAGRFASASRMRKL